MKLDTNGTFWILLWFLIISGCTIDNYLEKSKCSNKTISKELGE